MFIETETTPNPATLKFLPGRTVMEQGTANFADADAATRSPLALRLFALDGVTQVFYGADFVSVSKTDETSWTELKPAVLGALVEHFSAGEPLLTGVAEPTAADEGEDEIVTQIKDLIETRVRPAVAQDGGDIVFEAFTDGIVYLQMHGSCSGCPSSTATLKAGIENMLRHYIPEVVEVRAV
jgi:Fe-S cluster biogenesis protein NfuA